jgi:uncharacterized protein (TIGR02145 family)
MFSASCNYFKKCRVSGYIWVFFLLIISGGCQKEEPVSIRDFVWPYEGATYLRGEPILISIENIIEEWHIDEARVSVNGTLLTRIKESPFAYEWNTADAEPGIHLIGVSVFKGNNLVGKTSISVELTTSFRDSRDGRLYPVINIGSTIWMAENLAYMPSVSPPDQGSFSERFYYVNGYRGTSVLMAKSTDNYKKFGVLYNFPAALGACPQGWHLPGDDEWKELEVFLGMPDSDRDKMGMRGLGIDQLLKAENGWSINGNNTSGFSALPAGFCFPGMEFTEDGPVSIFGANHATWWTSTVYATNNAWFRSVLQNESGIVRGVHPSSYGLSVRCIKN